MLPIRVAINSVPALFRNASLCDTRNARCSCSCRLAAPRRHESRGARPQGETLLTTKSLSAYFHSSGGVLTADVVDSPRSAMGTSPLQLVGRRLRVACAGLKAGA